MSNIEIMRLQAERDEWKRKAEGAEERLQDWVETFDSFVPSEAKRDVFRASAEDRERAACFQPMLEALRSVVCWDCKDGVLLMDSLLFNLDREDEEQKCPNCTRRLEMIHKAEAVEGKR